jgi:uncharacterized protein YceH (UPF0502 family)
MSFDFSTALRHEADQQFKAELLAAIAALTQKVASLETKIDALTPATKKSKE